ncbi:MAG: response regulator [Cellulophaga sp.]
MKILFIEDDTIETMKLHRTVSKLEIKHEITGVTNGEEALDFLKSDESLPDIILLDLNMPRISGIEFLEIIKQDPTLQYIPIIILTTSENRIDLLKCYSKGIAGYLIKPLNLEDYKEKLKRLFQYWEINELVQA